jgi:3-hydroxy acid dehydrogenase / malonic semialdehyde reductase
MPFKKNRPIVAITGASAGIGAATARLFHERGYTVILLGRRQQLLQELQEELQPHAVAIALDVTDEQEVTKVFRKIEKEIGPIDVLINNAGCAKGLEPAFEADITDWKTCIQVNINGLLYCTRAALETMAKRNHGHIVNLGSIAGTYPYPGGHVYGATKAFVHQLTLNIRADLVATGKTAVRVSCIEPGIVSGTEFSVVRFRGDKKRARDVYKNVKSLLPEDIAKIIFFCVDLPEHVNINCLEVMPTAQASSPLAVHRTGLL